MSTFAQRLIRWQRRHGRRGLPWQTDDPYRIWLSEIMLQQTQVATVLDYYPRFLAAFPTVADLAAADEDDVMRLWAGLGYYSRARNLHYAARQIVGEHGGRFPASREELQTLKGVGRSTAAAIAAFAYREPETILDGNVRRVLCRVFALSGNPASKAFEARLWALAESLLPHERGDMPAYTQGLMDLGATVCRKNRPACDACPMDGLCLAKAQNRQHELPQKKSAAPVRQETVYWLELTRADGALLLQKRPPRGIWAGLYCLPSFAQLDGLYRFAAAYGLHPEDLHEGAATAHRLTHRLLDILPFRAACPDEAAFRQPKQSDLIWAAPEALPAYGLPKPLADRLARLPETAPKTKLPENPKPA